MRRATPRERVVSARSLRNRGLSLDVRRNIPYLDARMNAVSRIGQELS
jgi:hypothetical protein